MALTAEKQQFIEDVAKYVIKYAPQYGISVHSPIIAQAILESGWGKSKLSAQYHNYFGLKCGSKWTGKSVNMATKEEYTVGTITNIKANFRVYDSLEEGIKGYFEFIQLSRYSNLRGITNPKKYLELIKADGYATSSTYVADNYKVITSYNLTKYDTTTKIINNTDTNANVASTWKGKVIASKLNVRQGPGTKYKNIKEKPVIVKNTIVEVIKTEKAADDKSWYYIKISDNVFGYVSSAYIIKV